MRLPILIFACILFSIQSFSQDDKYQPVPQTWSITSTVSNCNPDVGDTYGAYNKSVCYLNDGPAVLLVNEKDKYSLVSINKLGATLWQVPIGGKTFGVGKRNSNFIVIYEGEHRELHAAVIDGKTHQNLLDKNIYTSDKQERNYFVENTPSGDFDHLLIRTEPKPRAFAAMSENTKTAKLEIISLDESLNPKVYDITNDIDGGIFIATVTGDNGDHFIATLMADAMVIKKYNADGKITDQLIANLSFRKFGTPVCKLDAENHNGVIICIRYQNEKKDEAIISMYADFSAKKVFESEEQVLDKSYQKMLKERIVKTPGIKSTSLSSMEYLTPVDIVTANGKIIVIKEIQYETSSRDSRSYFNEHIIVSSYNKKMQLSTDNIIDRYFEAFLPVGRSIGVHVKDNTMYIVSCSLISAGRLGTQFYAVDINSNTLTTNSVVTKQRFLQNSGVEGASTLWFPDCFILSMVHASAKLFRIDLSSSLKRIDY